MSIQVYDCLDSLNQFAAQSGDHVESARAHPIDEELGNAGKLSEEFVNELREYKEIQDKIEVLEKASAEVERSKDEMDNSFNPDDKTRIIKRVDKTLQNARATSTQIKEKLVGPKGLKIRNANLKAEEKEQGSVKTEIRENLYNFYMKKYFLAHKKYTSSSKIFKDEVHNRTKREIKVLNLSDEEAEALIEKGVDQKFIEQQLFGEDQNLKHVLAQADEVKQINQGVREILEMFQEMAGLVDAQQETIDNITAHISNTKHYTGEAVIELHAAAEYQLAARKKMLACAILFLVIIVVIILIVLGTSGAFDNNNNNN
ncbi:hypothetical protein AAMO2058_000545100 [Amorphochlora amoebiformis]|eukprot:1392743-Amorphochlora_amoeboformis.AAC.1